MPQYSSLDFALLVCMPKAYYIPDLLCLTRPQFLSPHAQSSLMAIHVLCVQSSLAALVQPPRRLWQDGREEGTIAMKVIKEWPPLISNMQILLRQSS